MEVFINDFQQATRVKLRFQTDKGPLTVEQIWDLPLTTLDMMAVAIEETLDKSTKSFLTKKDEEQALRFEILKTVIEVRVKEHEDAANSKAIAEKKQTLLQLIDEKKADSLKNMSIEDLQKELEKLA